MSGICLTLVSCRVRRSKSTNGVQVDSKSYAETLLGDDSTEQDGTRYLLPDQDIGGGNSITGGGDKEADEEARDALQRLVLTRQEDTNGLPPLQRLLDKSLRPFWSGALSTMRGVDEHIIAKARKRTDMEHDISNFVNRPRPKTATALTVSGLNKRQMEGYWKQLRSSYSGQKEHRHSSTTGTSHSLHRRRQSDTDEVDETRSYHRSNDGWHDGILSTKFCFRYTSAIPSELGLVYPVTSWQTTQNRVYRSYDQCRQYPREP